LFVVVHSSPPLFPTGEGWFFLPGAAGAGVGVDVSKKFDKYGGNGLKFVPVVENV